MASIVGKKRGNATYYYLVESARVDGKPRIVSQEYLGTAEELAAAMRGGGLGLPDRVQHKDFGAVAAAWGLLEDLGVAQIIDEVTGARRADAGASVGTYLVVAALNRLAAPCSKLALADWWAGTAAPRFTKIPAAALGHRRFWDAMHAVSVEQLQEISQAIALRMVQAFGLDCSSVALDMTNFATFIATANGKAPIAQRGKAKQKRSDLRDLARLPRRPARCHPVPRDDRPAPRPVPGNSRRGRRPAGRQPGRRRGHDGGVRRRAELRGQLRLPGRDRPALRGVGARLGLPGPDRAARHRAQRRRQGAVRRADRLRHPPGGLRRRAPRHPDPLTRAAREPGGRVRRHHLGQGRPQAR